MINDEDRLALEEIKSLTNKLQLRVEKFSEDEVFASCFDIGEVDSAFSLVEELVVKVRHQIDLMQQSEFKKDKEQI